MRVHVKPRGMIPPPSLSTRSGDFMQSVGFNDSIFFFSVWFCFWKWKSFNVSVEGLYFWTKWCMRAGSVGPTESLFLDAQIPFSALEKKSVTGPLSRFLLCSDIWCPVCARMPLLHLGVCFWRCTWIYCSLYTPTHVHTHSSYLMPYTLTLIHTGVAVEHTHVKERSVNINTFFITERTHTHILTHMKPESNTHVHTPSFHTSARTYVTPKSSEK